MKLNYSLIIVILLQICCPSAFGGPLKGTFTSTFGNCLSVSGNLGDHPRFEPCAQKASQIFIFDPNVKRTLELQSTLSNKCLNVVNGELILVECGNKFSYIWSMRNTEKLNKYQLTISSTLRLCLTAGPKDIFGVSAAKVASCADTDNQELYFKPLAGETVPEFNVNEITLKPGFLDSAGIRGPTFMNPGILSDQGAYSAIFTNTCRLIIQNVDKLVVWESTQYNPRGCDPNTAKLQMLENGNLCIFPKGDWRHPSWCSNSQYLGGRFLNFIGLESYGREYGLVIQTESGDMAWGKFGFGTLQDSSYILIPGNFLDKTNVFKDHLKPASLTAKRSIKGSYITNGENYVVFVEDGTLRVYETNPTWCAEKGIEPLYSTEKPSTDAGPYYFTYTVAENGCVKNDRAQKVSCLPSNSNAFKKLMVPLEGTKNVVWDYLLFNVNPVANKI